MQPRHKLPSRPSRLGQSIPGDEESRLLLGGEKKNWDQIEKQEMSRVKQGVRSFCIKISSIPSILSQIIRKRTRILSLEESVLHDIYKHLPLVDKACLSLTCKQLYDLFGAILKEKELEFPRLLLIGIPILYVNSSKVPRNQLLLRLESRNWAYCGRCLKLHPRKEFIRESLARPALERSCADYAGIVDLCRCVALTIRDLGSIAKLFSRPTPGQTKFGPFTFYRIGSWPFLRHSCSLPTTPDYKARFAMRISLNEFNQLEMSASYGIFFSSPETLKAVPIFHCPHWDLTTLMGRKDATQVCPGCRTISIRHRLPESKGRNVVVFEVWRILGNRRAPDYRWLDNCRLTGPSYGHDISR